MKVAVLMGGISKEREISFRSGKAIAAALKKKGHKVVEIDVKGEVVIKELKSLNPKAAFIALHGKFGEDGAIQEILEELKIPYTGPSVSASALCFDKLAAKEYLKKRGFLTPDHEIYRRDQNIDDWVKNYKLGFPAIVKPNTEGSTIGMTRIWKQEELTGAIEEALKFDNLILVERYIEGREITVGVHNGRTFPIVEVVPKSGFYDYEAKYTKGMTEYIVPTKISKELSKKVQKISENICQILKCEGSVRVDFMISKEGDPFFLEVNTIPGMTETSLLPKAAAACGLSFEDLCDEMVKAVRLKGGHGSRVTSHE